MPYIQNNNTENPAAIYFEDHGEGQPVILIHGWPLSHRAWEPQVSAIVDAGFRCISYDRRGFGDSSAPWDGYDYSSLASDLNELISTLDLKDAIIVGFSMGGGEVVRYLTDFGSDRIAKAALISSIIPIVPKTDDNPDGVPSDAIDGIMDGVKNNRPGFLTDFTHMFYNYDDNKDKVTEEQLRYDWMVAAFASPQGTIKAAKAWAETDFRPEMDNVDVPTLIIHGDADQVVPIDTAGKQAAEMIEDNQFETIEGGPHGLTLTHRDEVNEKLIAFMKG